MIFGVLKDIKEGENRVICTPVEVASIAAAGHTVLVETGAGVGSGFPDEKYAAAGAEIRHKVFFAPVGEACQKEGIRTKTVFLAGIDIDAASQRFAVQFHM